MEFLSTLGLMKKITKFSAQHSWKRISKKSGLKTASYSMIVEDLNIKLHTNVLSYHALTDFLLLTELFFWPNKGIRDKGCITFHINKNSEKKKKMFGPIFIYHFFKTFKMTHEIIISFWNPLLSILYIVNNWFVS